MKMTKKELVGWFNLLDDDSEIEFNVLVSKHCKWKIKENWNQFCLISFN